MGRSDTSKTTIMREWFLEGPRRWVIYQVPGLKFSFPVPLVTRLNPFVFQGSDDLESGLSSDVESKYKKIYEDDINPFAAFSRKVVSPSFMRFTLMIALLLSTIQ